MVASQIQYSVATAGASAFLPSGNWFVGFTVLSTVSVLCGILSRQSLTVPSEAPVAASAFTVGWHTSAVTSQDS